LVWDKENKLRSQFKFSQAGGEIFKLKYKLSIIICSMLSWSGHRERKKAGEGVLSYSIYIHMYIFNNLCIFITKKIFTGRAEVSAGYPLIFVNKL